MSELEPCPFGCGPAEVREWDWPYARFQVRCPKCKCSQGVRKADKAEAIAAWNTRTPPATQADDALVEELRNALSEQTGISGYDWRGALDAILPILHRREAAAHADGEAKGWADERAEMVAWLERNSLRQSREL